MDTQESMREVSGLRLRFQMNNRLRLESLAALSKVFREYGEPISDQLLSSIVLALPDELHGNGAINAKDNESKRDSPGPGTGVPGPGTGVPGPGTGVQGPGTGVPGPGTGVPGAGTGVPGPGTGVPGPGTGVPGPGKGVPGPGTGGPGAGRVVTLAAIR